MQFALPVIFLLLIMAVLSTMLASAPETGATRDMLTTSAISRTQDAGPSPP
ncbi:hypothetical protein [Pseudorhizobium flavum]|jgi:hypothetical protein|uniref:Uncharacterized protein n=1 Tax=Pseudorhizobium flavum TaxID=1335061 RepID=A0A7X0DEC8_9HYPH|nr:hypothetical protein [Pseudorhizobium flavum]MBB6180966.1 hypothetical protein [Pseudorhizobium flavum]CAD6601893.1 hypothetical protein RFYW14_00988 [Pseudorhizobium flavum]CAD6612070.1 hypothetical protein RKHAN_02454 [Rhizobium sp. Khangiran2]